MARDTVCGTKIDEKSPGALKVTFLGKPYFFCSLKCLGEFKKDPYSYRK